MVGAIQFYTVTDLVGDQVDEYKTEVVAGHTTTSFMGRDRKRRTTESLDDLIDQTITSRKTGRTWVHALLDRAPNVKEEIALLKLAPWFADRDSFPRERQEIGNSWSIDKAHIRKLLGGGIGAVSGTVEATFIRLDEVNKEQFAVINYKGNIRGRLDFSDPPELIVTVHVDITSARSLATGVDMETSGSITVRSHHQEDMQGPADVSEVISMTVRSSSKIENQGPQRKQAGIPKAPASGAQPKGH